MIQAISLERLNDLPLTRGLPHEVLVAIQPHLVEMRFNAGTVILKAGDYLDGWYYIVAGEADVRVPPPFGGNQPSRGMSGSVSFAGFKFRVEVARLDGEG